MLKSRKQPGFKRRRRQEGATMLVVMLVLISVTSLAVFSVHSTSHELRAAGHLRQSMQARFLAAGGIDATFGMLDNPGFGAKGLEHAIQTTRTNATYGAPTMDPFEPALQAGALSYRFFSKDFNAFGGFDPAAEAAMGPVAGTRQPYVPSFEVDINDYHEFEMPLPGEAVGAGGMSFRYATFTSRSRLSLRAGDFTGTAATDIGRSYHDVAHASRAYAVFGPL